MKTVQNIDLSQGTVLLVSTEPEDCLVQVDKQPLLLSFSAISNSEYGIHFGFELSPEAKIAKASVAWVEFLNDSGSAIAPRTPMSTGRNGNFLYLDPRESGDYSFNLFTPQDCVEVRIGLAIWNAPQGSVSMRNKISVIRASSSPLVLDTAPGTGINAAKELDSENMTLRNRVSRDSYILLSREPYWVAWKMKHSGDVRLGLTVDGDISGLTNKNGLVRVRYFGSDGGLLASRRPMKNSESVGDYVYLDILESDTYYYDLFPPVDCVEIQLGLQLWDAPFGALRVRNEVSLRVLPMTNQATRPVPKLQSSASVPLAPKRRARNLNVAIICDEFTFNSFKYEFNAIVLEPSNWREQMDSERPDVFFCESAWSGVDSEARPWKGRVYASVNFPKENRAEILEIIEYCNSNNIPTVFWNKEDPSHYEDRIHDFVKTAKLFDYVFTTDADCVERYKADHQLQNVFCLPFATQPRLFNPKNSEVRTSDVIFAGGWYSNHEQRAAEMTEIFGAIVDAGLQLEIFDRYFGTEDPLHMFPEDFKGYTRPAVSHVQLASYYKTSLFGLNINTVTDSSTMFARRVFELMSSNTLVISNYARGIEKLFGRNVVFVSNDSNDLLELTDQKVEELRHKNLHHVLRDHTYEARFRQILDTIKFDYIAEDNRLAIVALVSGEDEIRKLISDYRFCGDLVSGLVLVIDESVDDADVRRYYTEYNKLGCTVVSKSVWRKHGISIESLIGYSNFALVTPQDFPRIGMMHNAGLHLSYVDGPILFGSERKYLFTTRDIVSNLVAPFWYLESAVMNAGTEIRGQFYHV